MTDIQRKPVAITGAEVRTELRRIKLLAARGDHEAAHVTEDAMWERILFTIGNAPSKEWEEHGRFSRTLAREGLKSKSISFPRHAS